MSRSFIFKILLISCFLFSASFVSAADDCGPKPSEYDSNSWYEYRCQGNDCDNDILYRECEEICTRSCECVEVDGSWNWDCTSWSCDTFCGSSNIYQNCQSWQICSGSTNWTTSPLSCQCSGSCLEQPPLSFPDNGAENVKLPVILSWNSVIGANYYRYEIEGVDIDNNVIAATQATIKNCTLESNEEYNWRVQSCCDAAGDDCGDWSNNGTYWNFKTSLAPELLSPENNSTDIPVPVMFTWCEVNEAQSYYLRIYREGDINLFPFPITKRDGSLDNSFIEGSGLLTPGSYYEWEVATCLNEDGTKCGDEYDDDQSGSTYGEYSQKWEFATFEELPSPPLFLPEDSETVNQSNFLKWGEINGAFSYYYEIKKGGEVIDIPNSYTTDLKVSFEILWDYLEYDEEYTWHVKSCWDNLGEDCEERWSEEWKFKTTGAPPTNLSEGPTDTTGNPIIPVTLNWDNMPGALSYYYEIADATGSVKTSEVSISYPVLNQEETYSWQVKTCADNQGEVCGDASSQSFTTFSLAAPVNPKPENNGELLTSKKYIRWDKVLGANFYQYHLDFQGAQKIPPTIVSTNSALLPIGELELGNYTWWVKACLDEKCQETGEPAGPWHFTLVQGEGYQEKGIVPCGRDYDDPRTPWNEREPCQFKHIFIMLKNILDFVLWRLGLIILVLLVIATGVIYYFSMGAPQTMVKVKSLLKSAGTGYGIIFLAWIIINMLLAILGYQWELGDWWQISF